MESNPPKDNYQELEQLPIMGQAVIRPMNAYFDKRAAANVEKFVARYATSPDGTVNQSLADSIQREVLRRNDQSKMLDIWDRVANALLKFPVVLLATTALTQWSGFEKNPRQALLKGALAGAVVTAADIAWPLVRFEAAMYGGAQTAITMENLKKQVAAREAEKKQRLESFGPWTDAIAAEANTPKKEFTFVTPDPKLGIDWSHSITQTKPPHETGRS